MKDNLFLSIRSGAFEVLIPVFAFIFLYAFNSSSDALYINIYTSILMVAFVKVVDLQRRKRFSKWISVRKVSSGLREIVSFLFEIYSAVGIITIIYAYNFSERIPLFLKQLITETASTLDKFSYHFMLFIIISAIVIYFMGIVYSIMDIYYSDKSIDCDNCQFKIKTATIQNLTEG